jgi:hypothetical protein
MFLSENVTKGSRSSPFAAMNAKLFRCFAFVHRQGDSLISSFVKDAKKFFEG